MQNLALAALAGTAIGGCYQPKPRIDRVYEVDGLDAVSVRAWPTSRAAFVVEVRNDEDERIRLLWDDSTMTINGKSFGRLLRGETQLINKSQPQPPMPIPPGVTVREFAIAESLSFDTSADLTLVRGDAHGQLSIVFETADGEQTWVGDIAFDGKRHRDTPTGISDPADEKPPVRRVLVDVEPPADAGMPVDGGP